MATTIKLKNGSGAPLAADLVQGEPALDLTNKRLYTEDSLGAVIEIGTNPAAEIVANAGIALPDNAKATFGASDDLQIYHDPNNGSYIEDSGTGNLIIKGQSVVIDDSVGNRIATFVDQGNVRLNYVGVQKLATTATGIDVTGTVTADGLIIDDSANSGTVTTTMASNVVTHLANGSGAFASERWQLNDGGTPSTRMTLNTSGLDVTGTVTADGLTVDKSGSSILATLDRTDSTTGYINFKNTGTTTGFVGYESTDFVVYADNVKVMQASDGGDISFYEDTGTTPKLFWNAGFERFVVGSTTGYSLLSVSTSGTGSFPTTQLVQSDDRNSPLVVWNTDNAATYCAIRLETRTSGASVWQIGNEWKDSFLGDLVFRRRTGSTTSSDAMRIDSSGNLGLGVTPSGQLASYKSFQFGIGGNLIGRSDNAGIELSSNAYRNTVGNYVYLNTDNSASYRQYAGQHQWFTAPSGTAGTAITFTQAMTLDANGNLGIGTTSPSTGLHLNGSVATTYNPATVGGQDTAATLLLQNTNTAANTFASIDFNTNNDRVVNRIVSSHGGTTTDGYLAFITEGSGVPAERLRIDSSGNVGIGTTSPGVKLDVSDSTANQVKARIVSTGGTIADLSFDNTGASASTIRIGSSGTALVLKTAGTERMRIDSSGNLLVGTTGLPNGTSVYGTALSPQSNGRTIIYQATNQTAAQTIQAYYNPNGQVGTIATNGSATAYNTSSDARLKENIVDASSASDVIDAIQVRAFDWKSDGSHQRYGMVAQELLEVAPEAVSAPEDPDAMMGVDYSKLVPMLVKEIQDLRKRIAILESN